MLPVAHWPSVSWADEVFLLLGQPGPWLPVAPQTFSAQVSLLSVLWNGSPAMVWATPSMPFPSVCRRNRSPPVIQVASFTANAKVCGRGNVPVVNCWRCRLGSRGRHASSHSGIPGLRERVWWWLDSLWDETGWHHVETPTALKACKATEGFLEPRKRQEMGNFSLG